MFFVFLRSNVFKTNNLEKFSIHFSCSFSSCLLFWWCPMGDCVASGQQPPTWPHRHVSSFPGGGPALGPRMTSSKGHLGSKKVIQRTGPILIVY